MSAYTTKTITRKQAEEMIEKCRAFVPDTVSVMSVKELDEELHKYVYSEGYRDIVGCLYNYDIVD